MTDALAPLATLHALLDRETAAPPVASAVPPVPTVPPNAVQPAGVC